MKFFRWVCRAYGEVFIRWSTGKSRSKYFEDQLGQEELLGFQVSQAPMSKLLVAMVTQCRSDGFSFLYYDLNSDDEGDAVLFSKEFDYVGQVPIEPVSAMTIPQNLLKPLACHALWRLNHQDQIFESVNRNLTGMRNHMESNSKGEMRLNCRCWLRNPEDCRSLVIQVLDSVTPA